MSKNRLDTKMLRVHLFSFFTIKTLRPLVALAPLASKYGEKTNNCTQYTFTNKHNCPPNSDKGFTVCILCLQDCIAGDYSAAGASSCTQCPAGHKCANPGTVTPVACSSGSYATAGSSTCTTCPLGSYCTSTTTSPTSCASGTYTTSTGIYLTN